MSDRGLVPSGQGVFVPQQRQAAMVAIDLNEFLELVVSIYLGKVGIDEL